MAYPEVSLDLSNLSIGIYELIGLAFPVFLVICEFWVALRGWDRFVTALWNTNLTVLGILALIALGVGGLVQELSEILPTWLRGSRCLKVSRDEYWRGEESSAVKEFIFEQLKRRIEDVDTAFDYCLTRVDQRFPRRNTFIANSALAGSLTVVAGLSVIPLARIVLLQDTILHRAEVGFAGVLIAMIIGRVSWVRMLRFRELADLTVFRIYLATCSSEDRCGPTGAKAPFS